MFILFQVFAFSIHVYTFSILFKVEVEQLRARKTISKKKNVPSNVVNHISLQLLFTSHFMMSWNLNNKPRVFTQRNTHADFFSRVKKKTMHTYLFFI
jgi:predicted kinase